jgi:hypothetical protein
VPSPRMVALEKLAREHLESNPKWAEVFGAELAELRAAERKAMLARWNRVLDDVESPEHQRHLANVRRMRGRRPN